MWGICAYEHIISIRIYHTFNPNSPCLYHLSEGVVNLCFTLPFPFETWYNFGHLPLPKLEVLQILHMYTIYTYRN